MSAPRRAGDPASALPLTPEPTPPITPERWRQIKATVQGALERPSGEERAAFLDGACGGDVPLRHEVESLLLAATSGDTGFLEQPAALDQGLIASPALRAGPDIMGRLASALAERYAVEREIGRGGMATVYLARDLAHGRPVAVKVLRPELTALVGAERFLFEIRVTGELQHPRILPLLDSGEAGGLLYYAMPLADGGSLRERLKREGQLPLDDALAVARGVAAALDYAHQRGLVHRDVKPENILFYQGEPVVADFGIALAASSAGESRLTETGISLGTPHYMSPEQATADPRLDGRSDQYSLACVVYEMLAGEPPYTGPSPRTVIAKRLSEPVPHLGAVRQVPSAVEAAVTRALAKAPADRFPSAGDFARALTAQTAAEDRAAVDSSGEPGRRRWGWRRRLLPAAVASVALVAFATASRFLLREQPVRSIAVLPPEILSADSTQEYFAEGYHDALITELARYRQLRVISRASVMRYRGSKKSAPEIARELGVGGLVEGTVARDGDRVRITAQLIHGPSDRHLWAEHYERSARDVFLVQDDIAQAIARQVRVAVSPEARAPRMAERPVDPVVRELYLRGRYAWRSRNPSAMRQAMMFFKEAIAQDSSYAPAYSGLADAYRYYGGVTFGPAEAYLDSARVVAARALALDSTLAEAHTTSASLLADQGRWDAAEREFQRAIELNPSDANAHHWYATMLETLGRRDEGLREIRRAQGLDPFSAPINSMLGGMETRAGIPKWKRTPRSTGAALDPTNPAMRATRAQQLAEVGQCAKAVDDVKGARELAPNDVRVTIMLAGVEYQCGHQGSARALLAEAERSPDAIHNTVYIAAAHVTLGEPDSAFAWLALQRGWGTLNRHVLRVSPRLQPIRSDPRYAQVLRGAGTPN